MKSFYRAAILAGVVLSPHMALAGLEICNATKIEQSIAIGYKNGDIWMSEGWWNAAPGACVLPIAGNLANRYYYVSALATGHVFQGEEFTFCIQQDEFTIEGDEDCEGRGYVTAHFIEIDTGETATHYTKAITRAMSLASEDTPEPAKPAGKNADTSKRTQSAPVEEAPAQNAPVQEAPVQEAPVQEAPVEQPQTAGVTVTDGVISSGMAAPDGADSFVIDGHFQACGEVEGHYACSFHMNGWKFFAYQDGPTPKGMLEALADIEPGTPVELTGDILFYGDITAEVTAREVRLKPGTDPFGDILANLQGSWVSLDDPAAGMTIVGLELEDAHGEQALGTRFLQLADTCDNANGAGPVLIQTDPQDQDPQCYMVARADGQNLDLIYFARGNTLRYKRP